MPLFQPSDPEAVKERVIREADEAAEFLISHLAPADGLTHFASFSGIPYTGPESLSFRGAFSMCPLADLEVARVLAAIQRAGRTIVDVKFHHIPGQRYVTVLYR